MIFSFITNSFSISKTGVLITTLPFFLLLWSCSETEINSQQEFDLIEVERTGGVTVNQDGDQLASILEGLVVNDSLDMAYGVDLRIMRAYQLSLKTGEATFLTPEGKGPGELHKPVQITRKGTNEFLIFDTGLDQIAKYKNGKILNKYSAFSEHSIWARNLNGFYYDGFLITSMVDPAKVRRMDFDNAKPLAFLDYKSGKLLKKGGFSPTVDLFDSDNKYPVIYFDPDLKKVFYVFRTDYTVMVYDINEDITTDEGHYKPKDFRTKTIAVKGTTAGNPNAAQALGLDVTLALGIDRIEDQLIVIWNNYNTGFYENLSDFSDGNVDYFGVIYDLPYLTNPREFTLPGRFFGTYKNKLVVEENYGSMEIKLGFYEFKF